DNFTASNGATLVSLGRNILDDATGDATPDATDQLNTDPQIGPLELNMGTWVHPLLAGSPAIDAVALIDASSADQRGVARADGNGEGTISADIGAYEFAPFTYQIAAIDDVTLLYDAGSDEVRVVETGNPANILAAV